MFFCVCKLSEGMRGLYYVVTGAPFTHAHTHTNAEALGSLVYRYYHIGDIALANYGLVTTEEKVRHPLHNDLMRLPISIYLTAHNGTPVQTPPAAAATTNATSSSPANSTTLVSAPPLLIVSLRPAKDARALGEEEHAHAETRTYALTEENWGPVDTVGGGVCVYICLCVFSTCVLLLFNSSRVRVSK